MALLTSRVTCQECPMVDSIQPTVRQRKHESIHDELFCGSQSDPASHVMQAVGSSVKDIVHGRSCRLSVPDETLYISHTRPRSNDNERRDLDGLNFDVQLV
jgi:hypothetical protein